MAVEVRIMVIFGGERRDTGVASYVLYLDLDSNFMVFFMRIIELCI